jgi:putative hemolysin
VTASRRSRPLEADTIVGLVLLALSLIAFAAVSAAEAGVAAANRTRLKMFAVKEGSRRAERLHVYANERAAVLAVLALARTFAAALAAGVAVFLAAQEYNETWRMLLIAAVGAGLLLALLDALPRLMVAKNPETWGLRLVPLISLLRTSLGPLAWTIDRSLGHVVGQTQEERDQEEAQEILRLAEIETNGDLLEEDERDMLRGVVALDETLAREIMAPRIDIIAVEVNETIDDALRAIVDRGFSRIPLYDETIDNIVGVIYAKDLLRVLAEGRKPALRDIARPPFFIPESKRVDELLADLKRSKVHIAIVVDEYGGTAGLVTIEDLIEEIVGEIQDEYDREETPIERVNEGEAIIDARVSIDSLRELFGFETEDEDYDTIGGFVYHHLGKVPVAGDEVRVDGLTLRVLSVLGRRIKKVRATKVRDSESRPAVT